METVEESLDLKAGGLVPFTTADYPDCMSCVIFCQGCPWRCRYCHNPHLQPLNGRQELSWKSCLDFLKKRQSLLDAVVFSGGEPTLQKGLPQAIVVARALGFKIGLHTAGARPAALGEVLSLLDWVGLDIKASELKYSTMTGIADSGSRAFESLRLLLASNVSYEVRTTIHPDLLTPAEIVKLACELSDLGVKNYALQEFRSSGCTDQTLCSGVGSHFLNHELINNIKPLFHTFTVRRASAAA